MSPIPRAKSSMNEDSSFRRLRTILVLLCALMAVQIIISFGIWLDLPNDEDLVKSEAVKLETKTIVEDVIEQEESTAIVKESIEPDFKDELKETKPTINWSTVRIDVLNGCGVKGLASRTQEWLKKEGFRVRLAENADRHDYPKSFIQDRGGRIDAAYALADSLSIDPGQVITLEGTPSPYVDLTLVIGIDYKELPFGK